MNTTATAVRNQLASASRRAFGIAACAAVLAPVSLSLAAPARKLLYCGSDLGLGESSEKCRFVIEENGAQDDWSIEKTLARFDKFSDAARKRIVADCAQQGILIG